MISSVSDICNANGTILRIIIELVVIKNFMSSLIVFYIFLFLHAQSTSVFHPYPYNATLGGCFISVCISHIELNFNLFNTQLWYCVVLIKITSFLLCFPTWFLIIILRSRKERHYLLRVVTIKKCQQFYLFRKEAKPVRGLTIEESSLINVYH